MNSQTHFAAIEKPAGPPDIAPLDETAVDEHRRHTYLSYEKFLRANLAALDAARPAQWQRDYRNFAAYQTSVAPQRARLKEMLGFWQEPAERAPVVPTAVEALFDEPGFTARRFYLEILPGLETYAIELIPKTPGPHPGLIAQHGYSGTPESVCGFCEGANKEDYAYRSLGLRAVEHGFHVIAVHHPSGYGSSEVAVGTLPDFPNSGRNYGKNRLHRLAIMGGGTLFGLDMMASSRGVDFLLACDDVAQHRIGMYGLSQGGQSALFLPALDERIGASVSSAYFNWRTPKMIGPHRATSFLDSAEEDKFFRDVISHFSDSDIVSLIAPRAFAVEAGQHDTSVDFEKSQQEFVRAHEHYEKLGIPERSEFIAHAEGHVSATKRAFEFLKEQLAGVR